MLIAEIIKCMTDKEEYTWDFLDEILLVLYFHIYIKTHKINSLKLTFQLQQNVSKVYEIHYSIYVYIIYIYNIIIYIIYYYIYYINIYYWVFTLNKLKAEEKMTILISIKENVDTNDRYWRASAVSI